MLHHMEQKCPILLTGIACGSATASQYVLWPGSHIWRHSTEIWTLWCCMACGCGIASVCGDL